MFSTHILNNDKNGLIKAANSSLLHVCIYIGNTNTGIHVHVGKSVTLQQGLGQMGPGPTFLRNLPIFLNQDIRIEK